MLVKAAVLRSPVHAKHPITVQHDQKWQTSEGFVAVRIGPLIAAV